MKGAIFMIQIKLMAGFMFMIRGVFSFSMIVPSYIKRGVPAYRCESRVGQSNFHCLNIPSSRGTEILCRKECRCRSEKKDSPELSDEFRSF
ncbi:hypothetical membrane protein [Syntrophus aciditrophicus SB]|uniref:Hypothetical membrane protein n=1 Tax=Syntrophus aciditrophicus (strain SB) TaxID=56780 RepID=Q2LUB9_SYNAS|nr:hypothetical membrane protein [Syntrophus aciditrophicus SB]